MKDIEDVALFDMDGTLCDYDKSLREYLTKIQSPHEPALPQLIKESEEKHLKERVRLITSSEKWWANLPRFQMGWDIFDVAKDLDYKIMILTQGPRKSPEAWSGKKKWIDAHLGEDVDITITRDKGLVYGKVLVDDYPEYADRWLKWRPRGLVIMPAQEWNKDYKHKNVIRYDGSNLAEVEEAMKKAKERR